MKWYESYGFASGCDKMPCIKIDKNRVLQIVTVCNEVHSKVGDLMAKARFSL